MANAADASGSTSQGEKMKQDLAGDAEHLKDTAKQQARHKAEEGQQQTARTAQAASSAMRSAADELRNDENAPDWLASAVSSAAKQVSQFAEQVEGSSPDQIARRTSQFARENPTMFLTASAAAGFAAARFLRAAADYRSEHESGSSGSSGFDRGGTGGAGSASGFGSTGGTGSGYSSGTGTTTGTGTTAGTGTTTGTGATTGATSTGYSSAPTQGATTTRTGSNLGDRT